MLAFHLLRWWFRRERARRTRRVRTIALLVELAARLLNGKAETVFSAEIEPGAAFEIRVLPPAS